MPRAKKSRLERDFEEYVRHTSPDKVLEFIMHALKTAGIDLKTAGIKSRNAWIGAETIQNTARGNQKTANAAAKTASEICAARIQGMRMNARTRANLLKIVGSIKDGQVFSAKDVMGTLPCKPTAATAILKKMALWNLVEKADGHGKGKYRLL